MMLPVPVHRVRLGYKPWRLLPATRRQAAASTHADHRIPAPWRREQQLEAGCRTKPTARSPTVPVLHLLPAAALPPEANREGRAEAQPEPPAALSALMHASLTYGGTGRRRPQVMKLSGDGWQLPQEPAPRRTQKASTTAVQQLHRCVAPPIPSLTGAVLTKSPMPPQSVRKVGHTISVPESSNSAANASPQTTTRSVDLSPKSRARRLSQAALEEAKDPDLDVVPTSRVAAGPASQHRGHRRSSLSGPPIKLEEPEEDPAGDRAIVEDWTGETPPRPSAPQASLRARLEQSSMGGSLTSLHGSVGGQSAKPPVSVATMGALSPADQVAAIMNGTEAPVPSVSVVRFPDAKDSASEVLVATPQLRVSPTRPAARVPRIDAERSPGFPKRTSLRKKNRRTRFAAADSSAATSRASSAADSYLANLITPWAVNVDTPDLVEPEDFVGFQPSAPGIDTPFSLRQLRPADHGDPDLHDKGASAPVPQKVPSEVSNAQERSTRQPAAKGGSADDAQRRAQSLSNDATHVIGTSSQDDALAALDDDIVSTTVSGSPKETAEQPLGAVDAAVAEAVAGLHGAQQIKKGKAVTRTARVRPVVRTSQAEGLDQTVVVGSIVGYEPRTSAPRDAKMEKAIADADRRRRAGGHPRGSVVAAAPVLPLMSPLHGASEAMAPAAPDERSGSYLEYQERPSPRHRKLQERHSTNALTEGMLTTRARILRAGETARRIGLWNR